MSQFFIYYTESTIICLIIFAILLVHDLLGVDRQEKQIKFDHALIAFMLYFVSDGLWAAIIGGVIPSVRPLVVLFNFTNYLFMAAITYNWYRYVLAVEQVPNRERKINSFAVLFPFLVSTIAFLVILVVSPYTLIDENNKPTVIYSLFQVTVPIIYILAILSYTITRSIKSDNPIEKRKHLYVGLFPLMVVAGGLFQIIVLPKTPIFCYCCALLMIVFYIQSMDSQISTDALTGLNNRGQLLRYISSEDSLFREGRRTYILMLDVNSFKLINDTYGHSQGDLALTMIADALRAAAADFKQPVFIGRYGGDEFILIAHPKYRRDIDGLVDAIRSELHKVCETRGTPFETTVAIGFDELRRGDDSFQDCLERADQKLYENKSQMKEQA